MLTPAIRAVFFDAVGTLILPDPPVADVYAEAGRRHGCDLPHEHISKRFRDAFRAESQKDAILGGSTSEEREFRRWRTIVESVFDRCEAINSVFDELYAHFARPDAWRVMDVAGDALRQLAARGLVLGIASNFDHRLNAIIDGSPELALIRHRVISSQIGWLKPSPRFFDAVIQNAGCAPNEILFVGDDRINDYTAANAAGMRAVLFNPLPEEIPGARRIRHFAELVG